MAVVRVDFFSNSISRNINLSAIIPLDQFRLPGGKEPEFKPFQTLYLIHGMGGSNMDWLYHSRIAAYAAEKNIAVIMPDLASRCYVDSVPTGELYGQLLGKEIVEFTRKLFPLSTKREDTYIGGFSAGGDAAVQTALQHPETFGGIISLAGGDFEASTQRMLEAGAERPKAYLACGLSDPLLEDARRFAACMKQIGIDVCYEENEGTHDWRFVDACLPRALAWWLSSQNI